MTINEHISELHQRVKAQNDFVSFHVIAYCREFSLDQKKIFEELTKYPDIPMSKLIEFRDQANIRIRAVKNQDSQMSEEDELSLKVFELIIQAEENQSSSIHEKINSDYQDKAFQIVEDLEKRSREILTDETKNNHHDKFSSDHDRDETNQRILNHGSIGLQKKDHDYCFVKYVTILNQYNHFKAFLSSRLSTSTDLSFNVASVGIDGISKAFSTYFPNTNDKDLTFVIYQKRLPFGHNKLSWNDSTRGSRAEAIRFCHFIGMTIKQFNECFVPLTHPETLLSSNNKRKDTYKDSDQIKGIFEVLNRFPQIKSNKG